MLKLYSSKDGASFSATRYPQLSTEPSALRETSEKVLQWGAKLRLSSRTLRRRVDLSIIEFRFKRHVHQQIDIVWLRMACLPCLDSGDH